ncbi:cytoplasmic protein NCK2-like isoform X2 [Branchiostoma lanceolatum]
MVLTTDTSKNSLNCFNCLQPEELYSMMTEKEEVVVAKYNYEAQQDQELDIKKNERLTLLDDTRSWWRVQNAKNQVGYVPSNYVKRENSKKGKSIKGIFGIKNKVQRNPSDRSGKQEAEPSVRGRDSPSESHQLNIMATVKFNYTAARDDEISLEKGGKVVVMEKSSDGWWRGEYNGTVGWFPSNYVIEDAEDSGDGVKSTGTVKGGPNAAVTNGAGPIICVVRTLYPFTSRNEEELNFEKGEFLDIVEKPEDDPEWWKARNQQGEAGLVPKNYVQVDPGAQPVSFDPVTGITTQFSTTSLNSAVPSPARHQPFPDKDWYYGKITRTQADQWLNQHGGDGDFLVRDSESNEGDYSISLKAPNRNKHFRVQKIDSGGLKIGQRTFMTMDELIEHYKRAPIFNSQSGEEKLFLVRPFFPQGS